MAILYSYPLSPLINADDLIPGTLEDSKTTVNWKVSTLATYISNTQNVSTNRIPKYDGSKFVNSPFLVSNATTVKTEADIWFPTRGIKDTNNNIGVTGQVLSSFNGGLKWIPPGGGYFLDVPSGTTKITLNDATGQTTDVELSATGNISLTRIDANNIQIGSTPINKATSTVLGTVKLYSDAVQNINAQIISSDLNRTYGLQFNSQDQGVINVPWVDTQYAVFTGATAGNDGSTGLVPQPLQGEELKFLRADATWADNPGITYTLTGVTVNTTDFNINLNPSPGTTESVTLKPGTNVTLTGGTNEVTINAVDQFDGTVTSITPAADSGTGTAITTVGTLTFTGSGDITTSVSGDTVTIGYTDTPYVLPVATSSALGGIKIGYTQNAKNYPVVLSSEQAYVNVPWTDNNDNTTYILGKAAGSTDLILKADGTAQDTITFSGTTNEVTVTGVAADAYIFGLPDDVTVAGELTVSGTGQSSFSGQVTVLATPSASTDAASKGYVDGLVSGGLTFRGTFRADTGEIVSGVSSGSFLYNCPGGVGTRVAVSIGDYYIVATAGGQFYCSGTNLDIGDSIIATANAAADSSVVTGWSIVQSDEGVTDFSSTKGTYIDITNNANAVGSVDIGTVDLNAVDGTAGTNTRFLSKDNTWDVPSYTTDNDTTYTVDVPSATTSINLAGSDGTNDAIVLTGGTNVTLSRTDASTIDIAATNTEYVAMTSTVLGLGKLFDDTEQTVGATAVSAITARTYGVQMNSSNQLVVNVPWTNTQNAFQTITGTGSNNLDSGILLSDSGGTVKILGAGNVTAAQSGNTITLTGTGSDTTYTYTSAQSTNDVDLILTDSSSATNIVKLVKGSNITLTDSSNSVTIAAQNDNDNDFLTGLAFNTGSGVLTATVQNQSDVTVDLDGRYFLSSGGTISGPVTIGDAVTIEGDLFMDDYDITSVNRLDFGFLSGYIEGGSTDEVDFNNLSVKIGTISNATTDTDKFLVSDSGVIKYRTGAEVRSDIGAGTGSGTVTGTGTAKNLTMWATGGTGIEDSPIKTATVNTLNQITVTDGERIIIDKPSTVTSGDPAFQVAQDGAAKTEFGWDDDGGGFAFVYNYSGNGIKLGAAGNNPMIEVVTTTASEGVNLYGNVGIATAAAAGGFNVNNTTVGSYYNMSNHDSGNYKYTNPAGRLLTSNGSGWVSDGRDPILTLSSAGNGGATTVGYSLGLNLYSNTSTDNTYSPLICFSNQSNSGSYATTYAAIGGKKTGQGVDANWSAGELHFWTAGPAGSGSAAYMQQASAMMIDDAGQVGIGTNSPAFKLDIRTSTPGDRAVLGVNSATSGTNYGGQFNSQGSGATKNIGLYATAEGATTNYAGIFDSGQVGIGTTSPKGKLNVQYDMAVDTGSITGFSSGTTRYGNINFSGVAAQGGGQNGTTMQGITWSVNNYGGTTDYGNQAQLVVGNNGDVGTFMGFFTSNNYSLAPVEKMRITSDGNVSMQKGTYAGQDLAVSTNNLEISGDNSNGTRVGLRNFGSASSIVLFENSNVPPGFAGYSRTGTTYMSLNTSGQFNIGGTSGTGAEKNAINMDFSDGSLAFSQYGSGNITGTAAYNLSVDSSGNVIETVNAAANPPVLEQTWTFTRAELLAGFGGGGSLLIAGQGAAKFVVITDSWWKTKGTGTSNNGWTMQVRQNNQIPGVQTVSLINGTQWNYMTNANAGNGMFYRDTPAGGAAGRPYAENQQTTLHIANSTGSLSTSFTSLSVKLKYRIFDNNF